MARTHSDGCTAPGRHPRRWARQAARRVLAVCLRAGGARAARVVRGGGDRRSMSVETDRNGLIWAWRAGAGGASDDAIVTGSHLDSVPGGGAFDGPLGIASALAAVDLLDERGVVLIGRWRSWPSPRKRADGSGWPVWDPSCDRRGHPRPRAHSPRRRRQLSRTPSRGGPGPGPHGPRRRGARTHRCVRRAARRAGPRPHRLSQPVAIGSSILGHGRWRLTVTGEGTMPVPPAWPIVATRWSRPEPSSVPCETSRRPITTHARRSAASSRHARRHQCHRVTCRHLAGCSSPRRCRHSRARRGDPRPRQGGRRR